MNGTWWALIGSVAGAMVTAIGLVIVSWLKKHSDEQMFKDRLLLDTRSATNKELEGLVSVLRKEADSAREEVRKAHQAEIDADNRWRVARSLALKWEEEADFNARARDTALHECDRQRERAEENLAALATAQEELEQRRRDYQQLVDQNERIFNHWTGQKLMDQVTIRIQATWIATARDRIIALRNEVMTLGGDPGPEVKAPDLPLPVEPAAKEEALKRK